MKHKHTKLSVYASALNLQRAIIEGLAGRIAQLENSDKVYNRAIQQAQIDNNKLGLKLKRLQGLLGLEE